MRIRKNEQQKLVPLFLPSTFEPDPRLVIYDLIRDRTRRIVFAPDPEEHGELFETIQGVLQKAHPIAKKRLMDNESF